MTLGCSEPFRSASSMELMFYTGAMEQPVWQRATEDGRAARAHGEPRDPTPYLERYRNWRGAQSPAGFRLQGYDAEDERLPVEASRPTLVGEVEWRPVRRLRDAGEAQS